MALDSVLFAPFERWVARRHGNTGGTTTLRYRRVYILPSRAGMTFAGLLVLIWLGAINYSNNLAFMLTFLLAGIALAGMHHAFHNLVGLRVVPADPPPVFAGGHAHFPLTLENDRRRSRTAIEVNGSDAARAQDVPAGGSVTARVEVPAPTRGRLSVGRISLATRYPTGLFRAWSWVQPTASALIYPSPERGVVPPPTGHGEGHGGTPEKGDEDFDGLRRYQRGDPVGRVAWKALAARELQVKVFVSGEPEQLVLDWNATAGLPHEQRISRLCRWVLDAERQGAVYRLDLPGARLGHGSGPEHQHRCLAALALMP